MKTLQYLVTCSLFILLLACDRKASDDSSTVDITGTPWATSCAYRNGVYQIMRVQLDKSGTYTSSGEVHSNASCTALLYTTSETGTYNLSPRTSPSGDQSENLDWVLGAATMTPATSSIVSSLNTDAFCGATDWTLGVPKSLLGLTCGTSTIPTAGAISYDFYTIASYDFPYMGIKVGDLQFGFMDTDHDGSSPAKRPTSASANYIFRR